MVDAGTNAWTVPTAATCSFSGNSIPIVLTVPAAPFTDVTMTLAAVTYKAPAANPSENITLPSTVLTFSTTFTTGTLSFSCGTALASATTPQVKYTLAGTDAKAYALSGSTVTVTGQKKGE